MTSFFRQMRRQRWSIETLYTPALTAVGLLASFWLGRILGTGGIAILSTVATLLAYSVAFVVVWRWPYWGIILVTISRPLTSLVLRMPFLGSALPLFGGVALASYVFHEDSRHKLTIRSFRFEHILGLLFILWMLGTHPIAATAYTGGRIWAFTYLQLLVLMWLASEVLTISWLQTLMWVYVVVSVVSAWPSVVQAQSLDAASRSVRLVGLAASPNMLAGSLLFALVFLRALHVRVSKRWVSMLCVVFYAVIVLTITFAVSYTAYFALIWLVPFLMWWVPGRHGIRWSSVLWSLLVVLVIAWLIVSMGFLDVTTQGFEYVTTETGPFRYRVGLWSSTLDIWLNTFSNMMRGVGPGQFIQEAQYVASSEFWGRVPHSLYLTLLAEYGMVGFAIFAAMILAAFRNLWIAARAGGEHGLMARAWLLILLLVLFTGLSGSNQYDKIPWLVFGVGIALRRESGNTKPGQDTAALDVRQ